jgi:RNA polymerase sigma factor (sigma-70 family)
MSQLTAILPIPEYSMPETALPPDTASPVDYTVAVQEHYTGLYQFAYQLTGNRADAEDLTQTTYLQLARKIKKIRQASKVKSWLFTTLYRQFVDQYRKKTRYPKVELQEVPSESRGPREETAGRLDGQLVVQALANLKEDLRAPLSLFYLEDFSYKEIAETLKVPLGTVMSRLHRGKALLYDELQSALPESAPTQRG